MTNLTQPDHNWLHLSNSVPDASALRSASPYWRCCGALWWIAPVRDKAARCGDSRTCGRCHRPRLG